MCICKTELLSVTLFILSLSVNALFKHEDILQMAVQLVELAHVENNFSIHSLNGSSVGFSVFTLKYQYCFVYHTYIVEHYLRSTKFKLRCSQYRISCAQYRFRCTNCSLGLFFNDGQVLSMPQWWTRCTQCHLGIPTVSSGVYNEV